MLTHQFPAPPPPGGAGSLGQLSMDEQAASSDDKDDDKDAVQLRDPARFIGRFTNKIDTKGRVSVPADLRRYLDPGAAEPAPMLYCFPSLFSSELQCGGPDLVKLILSTIETVDIFGGDHFEREAEVTGETRRLYFDDNGRVVVPKDLREHAGLSGEVAFHGRGQHFVMAPPAGVKSLRDRARDLTPEQRQTIKARSAPSFLAKGEGA
ncbi:MAG: hypothetical protein AAF986_01150 [Pseudomonadota bacterium]